jgi:hypothetical protein
MEGKKSLSFIKRIIPKPAASKLKKHYRDRESDIIRGKKKKK